MAAQVTVAPYTSHTTTTGVTSGQHPNIGNPVSNIPPGFSIPQNFVTTSASDHGAPGSNSTTITMNAGGEVPTIQTSSAYPVLDPSAAGASTTTSPTAHLFTQNDSNYSHGKINLDRYIFIPLHGVFGRLHFFTFYSPYIPNFDSI